MGGRDEALRSVAGFYRRSGCIRGPIPERLLRDRWRYHTGWEMRISVEPADIETLQTAMRSAGISVASAFRERGRFVQPIYQRHVVAALVREAREEMPPGLGPQSWGSAESRPPTPERRTGERDRALRMVGHFFREGGTVYAPVPDPQASPRLTWRRSARWSAHIAVAPDARVVATLQGHLAKAGLRTAKLIPRPGVVVQPVHGREQVLVLLRAAGVETRGL
ncbi:hypothetical protein EDD29_4211 [Actinocorallia herbida]|uniref:Uncharacterized protein n=1 Tax=Actinocorallia herbida TaxID=58109 RepID=A0A3N1CZH4_9ACTN|nr:hypothetical protein [Actinocorallia herbida]ROO86636.1 hypothetical protein EDD29_4211 [Actinocorallia herbida]